MVAPTNVRAGRATALLAAFQTAKGTTVSDFTTASAARLWTESLSLPANVKYGSDAPGRGRKVGWMDSDKVAKKAGRFKRPENLEGDAVVLVTPESLEWLLRSNYGTFSLGSFTLETQIANATRWLTLGWVENTAGGTQNFVRLTDAWFHRVELVAEGPVGRVVANASFASRSSSVQALNAGGITLPAAPMMPDDLDVFSVYGTRLYRDPAGVNQELRFRSLRLTFDQKLGRFWDMKEFKHDVFKKGKLAATLEIESEYGDETWQILTNSRAGTDDRYRVTMTAGSSTFQVDLYNVAMEVDPIGHDAQDYREFRAVGMATEQGGNSVTISLT